MARATNQARPGEVFTGAAAARGATPPGMLRLAPARPSTELVAQLHHDHRRGAHQQQEKEVMKLAWRRQRVMFPSGIPPRISSVRKRPANLLSGGKKGSRGEHFALGGGGGTRRNRPESPGDGGGDLGVTRERVEGERRERPRQVWVGLTDPGPGRLG
jgi:hypothetical protein